MKSYRFRSISFIFGIGNGFLQILQVCFLKLDKNMAVLLFFLLDKGWGYPLWYIYFLSTPSCQIFSTSFLKTYFCVLGTSYGFAWYVLECGCRSVYTGFLFQVPSTPSKRNSYLLNILCSIACSSSVKYFISCLTLHCSHLCGEGLRCNVCDAWCPAHVCFPVVLHSEIFHI